MRMFNNVTEVVVILTQKEREREREDGKEEFLFD
jgi:hypothetical protein